MVDEFYFTGVDKLWKVDEVQKHFKKKGISRQVKDIGRSAEVMSPERIEEIRQRIAENFYDDDEVLKKVAERILKGIRSQDLARTRNLDKNI